MRKHYLDNIRWATVLLVLLYHVFYIFNGVGILGGIPNAENIPVLDAAAGLIYPWFMVLLFVISGMSARYALNRRTGKEFIRERARKLLVPCILGPFVVHWVTGYLNIRMGGGLGMIPGPLVYPISILSGTGPLWFIQVLFLFSCLLVLVRKMDRNDRAWMFFEKTPITVLYLLAIVLFGAAQILNLPVLTTYRFGIYCTAFLIGYFVLSHDAVQERVSKSRIWSLGLAILFGVFYGIRFSGTSYTLDACLKNGVTNLYLWFMVLAILGFSKRYWNRRNAVTDYLSRGSFGLYILHYPVLLTVAFLLVTYFKLPAVANYGIALVLQVILTFVIYEGLKRIPILRYWVLGIRKKER